MSNNLRKWLGLKENKEERNERKRATDQSYDKEKRLRTYQTSWEEGRPWLKFDKAKGLLYCELCVQNKYGQADEASSFVTGSSSLQLTSVKVHQESIRHKREEEFAKAANMPSDDRPADKLLRQMNQETINRRVLQFRTAHAVAKHNRPYTDYVWLNQLDRVKGLSVGREYGNDHSAAEFSYFISEVERDIIKEKLAKSQYVALIIDGATDSSVTEQEMMYVRTCIGGKVTVNFLAVINTPKADADGIVHSIQLGVEETLETSMADFAKKFVATGTDGASVMLGKNNSVVRKLQQMSPSLVGIHCFCHRMELACRDVIRKHQMYARVEQLLLDLYLFYKNSNLNRANLKESCTAAGVKFLVPTRVGGTRWLPHTLRALNNLWRTYPALVLHLSQVKQNGQSKDAIGRASGFLKKLSSQNFVEVGHFVWDVVILLSKFSLFLQKKTISVSHVAQQLAGKIAVLENFKTKPGPKLEQVLGKTELRGVSLSRTTDRQHTPIDEISENVLDDLIDNLKNRFDMSDDVVAATSLVDFKSWPRHEEKELINDFGDNYVRALMQQFQEPICNADIQPDQILPEWTELKTFVYNRFPEDNQLDSLTWERVNRLIGDQVLHFLSLVDLVLTIPATSVEAERGFSMMKLIKTDYRNRMTNKSLNVLLRIKLLSPPEETFDPLPAILKWQNHTSRRIRGVGSSFSTDELIESSSDDECSLTLQAVLDNC